MTRQEVHEMVDGGGEARIGEFRFSKADTIQWRDKADGKAKTMPTLKHTVEFGNESVDVAERVGDDFNPSTYVQSTFLKGEKVVLVATTEKLTIKGHLQYRGKLVKLDGDSAPVPPASGNARR